MKSKADLDLTSYKNETHGTQVIFVQLAVFIHYLALWMPSHHKHIDPIPTHLIIKPTRCTNFSNLFLE